jgi:hypothetical protein
MDGLHEEIVESAQRVTSQVNLLVEMFRPAGEFIRTSQHSNVNSQSLKKSIREHIIVQRETWWPPFYLANERDISLFERAGGLQGISDFEVTRPRCVFPKYKVYGRQQSKPNKSFISYCWWNSALNYISVSQPLWYRGPVNSFFITRGPGPNKFTRKYLSNFFNN